MSTPVTDYTLDPGIDPTAIFGPYASMLLQLVQLAVPNSYRGMVIVSPTTPATTGQPTGYPSGWYTWHQRCVWIDTSTNPPTVKSFNTGTGTWVAAAANIAAGSVGTTAIIDASVTLAKLSLTGTSPGDIIYVNGAGTAWANGPLLNQIATGTFPVIKLSTSGATSGQILTNVAGTPTWSTLTQSNLLALLGYASVAPNLLSSGSALQVLRSSPGSGAAAGTVTLGSGSVTAIAVGSGGSGYTTAPLVAITGGGGSGATATAVLTGGSVTGFTIGSGGTGYTSAPTVTLLRSPEWFSNDYGLAFSGVESGTSSAYVVTVASSWFGLAAGNVYFFSPGNTSTVTNPTLNINGTGAKNILAPSGGALAIGNLASGSVAMCYYNGTSFILINPVLPSSSVFSPFVSSLVAVPASAGTGSFSAGQAHGFGAAPTMLFAYLVCQTGEGGYVAGDIVPATQLQLWGLDNDDGEGDYIPVPAISAKADASNVYVVFNGPVTVPHSSGGQSYRMSNPTNAGSTTFTPANWKVKVVAIK
jgi:hypothetical protein